jgi:hypothetical protein
LMCMLRATNDRLAVGAQGSESSSRTRARWEHWARQDVRLGLVQVHLQDHHLLPGSSWRVRWSSRSGCGCAGGGGDEATLPGVWTFDRVGPAGDAHSAEEIHAMTLANLNGEFARIVSAADAIAALQRA